MISFSWNVSSFVEGVSDVATLLGVECADFSLSKFWIAAIAVEYFAERSWIMYSFSVNFWRRSLLLRKFYRKLKSKNITTIFLRRGSIELSSSMKYLSRKICELISVIREDISDLVWVSWKVIDFGVEGVDGVEVSICIF